MAGLTGEANILEQKLVMQYFGAHNWQVLPDDRVLIRPEYLKIQTMPSAGSLEAEVRWSVFEGSRYRVGVHLGAIDLIVYSDKMVVEKQKVCVELT